VRPENKIKYTVLKEITTVLLVCFFIFPETFAITMETLTTENINYLNKTIIMMVMVSV